MENDGRRDFDFLFGSWRVRNRRLAQLLVGSDEWHEFETTAEARPILGGLGNVDSFTAAAMPPENTPWEGVTLRLFDPRGRRWRIWWTSTTNPGQLDPPMIGRFQNGLGVFFGTDVFAGTPIRVRFQWRSLGPSQARWEQAFSADDGAGYETNWIMTFERSG